MNEEMRVEAMELCVTACEKHASSNEVIASLIELYGNQCTINKKPLSIKLIF